MVRISMNELTTYRWSFEQDVAAYRKGGFSGIGVWRQKLSDFGEEAGVRLLVESGLRVSNLLWAGGFTGSEGRSLDDSVEDADHALRLACCMDAGCLVLYTGSRGGHTVKHAWRLARNALRELVPMAEAVQVPLAIEPMHEGCAGEWTYLTDLSKTVSLIDEVGSDQLKIVFDTYHFGQPPVCLRQIEELAPRIAIVHVADSHQPPCGEQNRCLLGEGEIPLAEIVSALKSGGYDGFFDVELRGEDIEPFDYPHLIEHSKSALSGLIRV